MLSPKTASDESSQNQKPCPECGIKNDINNQFCIRCGFRFDGGRLSEEQPESEVVSSPVDMTMTSAMPAQSRPTHSQSLKLLSPEPQQSPAADLLARYQVTLPLNTLYFQVGLALMQSQAYVKAAEAFQNALDADISPPQESDVLFALAYASELSENKSRAFRTYLEAILEAPDSMNSVLLYLHGLLTPDTALAQNKWVLREWEPRVKSVCQSDLNRMHVTLLIGHIYLYLDNYTKAQERFIEGRQLAPDIAPSMAPYLLSPKMLSPALTEAETDGNVAFILAQLYHALGHSQWALEEVNHALERGITENSAGDNTLARAYQLRAQLSEHAGKMEEAAKAYSDAGLACIDHQLAVELHRNANRLNPQNVQMYWNLANALYIQSYDSKDTFKLIYESVEVWQKGYEIHPPGVDDAWAYILRALICEQLENDSKADAWALTWEGVAYMERSRLLSSNALTDAYLGRFYRASRMMQNALDLTEKAINADSENTSVLIERAIALLEVAQYTEAEKVIDRCLELQRVVHEPDNESKTFKCVILYHAKQYAEARQLAEELVTTYPENIFYHSLLSVCLRQLGDSQAEKENLWIMGQYDDSDTRNMDTYGWCAYYLGKTDLAMQILQGLPDKPGDSPSNSFVAIGLCLLLQGKLEQGEENLNRAIAAAVGWRHLDAAVTDIEDFEVYFPSAKNAQVHAIFERVREKINERRVQLEQPRSAEDELSDIVEKILEKGIDAERDEAEVWAGIAALAGLGRLYAEQGSWYGAGKMYVSLMEFDAHEREKSPLHFPEARTELEKAADKILDIFEGYAKSTEKIDPNDQDLERPMYFLLSLFFSNDEKSFVPLADDTKRIVRLACLAFYLMFFIGEDSTAHDFITVLLQIYRNDETLNPGISPGESLGIALHALLGNAQRYWELDAKLGALVEPGRPDADEQLRHDIADARKAMAVYLDEEYKLLVNDPDNTISDPLVTPLALEVSLRLVPVDLPDDATNSWILFKEFIPQMRQRVKDDLGIEVPGVQVRNNLSLPEYGYTIVLWDIPVVTTTVPPDMGYCPISFAHLQELGIPAAALVPSPHPLTGSPGCWVGRDYWSMLTERGLDLWTDALLYATYHIEAIVRRNVGPILDLQIEQLLYSWEKREEIQALLMPILEDNDAGYHLGRLMRALVQERISIANAQALLTCVKGLELGAGNFGELLGAVRLAMKEQLPGNKQVIQRLELSPMWEEKLHAYMQPEGDFTTFVVPLEEQSAFLAMVQDWAKDQQGQQEQQQEQTTGWNMALITQSAELRPFIWLLTQKAFPDMVVLSQEERLSLSEMREDTQAETAQAEGKVQTEEAALGEDKQ